MGLDVPHLTHHHVRGIHHLHHHPQDCDLQGSARRQDWVAAGSLADHILIPVCARPVLCCTCQQDLVRPVPQCGPDKVEGALPCLPGVATPLLASQQSPGAILLESSLPQPVPVHSVLAPVLAASFEGWVHDFVEGNTSFADDWIRMMAMTVVVIIAIIAFMMITTTNSYTYSTKI